LLAKVSDFFPFKVFLFFHLCRYYTLDGFCNGKDGEEGDEDDEEGGTKKKTPGSYDMAKITPS